MTHPRTQNVITRTPTAKVKDEFRCCLKLNPSFDRSLAVTRCRGVVVQKYSVNGSTGYFCRPTSTGMRMRNERNTSDNTLTMVLSARRVYRAR